MRGGPGEKPRFALICGGSPLEAWHVECLDQLSTVAELAAVLVASELQPTAAGRRVRRHVDHLTGALE
jgi:hypothetical protein